MRAIFQAFKRWPVSYKCLLFIALLGFWFAGARFSYRHGNQTFHRSDGASEGIAIHAANHFYQHGFFSTWLLSMSPAFGLDGEGKQRTEPFVYTHYFPGPSLVLGLTMKVLGADQAWMARLIPLTLTVVALFFLAVVFGMFVQSPVLGLVFALALLTSRALTIFSIGWWGQGYVLAFYIFMMSLLIGVLEIPALAKWFAPAFSVFGFLQMEFAIDWVPLSFLSIAAMSFLLPKFDKRYRNKALVCFFLGACGAMFLQLVLASLYYGSFSATVDDFVNFGKWRMGAKSFPGDAPLTQFKLFKVLREYNNQAYGATGFTAYGLLILSAVFIVLGYMGSVFRTDRLKQYFLGLLLAYFSAAAWNYLMRQHSMIHVHFIPRHYFVLLFMLLLIALPISKELVTRSRAYDR